jgi:hypothetical protein
MKKYFFLSMMLLVLTLTICSCSSGSLYIEKAPVGKSCSLQFTFNNEGGGVIKPIIEYIVFDPSGNTIKQSRIFFDIIIPQKSQTKSHGVGVPCEDVDSIVILRASERNNFPIQGVSGNTYKFH